MLTTLRLTVLIETASVITLFLNLATVHVGWVAGLVGPLHGTAYLAVIALVTAAASSPTRARWLAVVPVVGGWLALRELARASSSAETVG